MEEKKKDEKKDEKQQLSYLIAKSQQIVFFGGAGVSTESGIPDFRSSGGIYQDKKAKEYARPPEVMLSHSFFERHPAEFFSFYFDRMIYPEAKPNKAHLALAKLEEQGKLAAVITQNVDGLHQDAGSQTVLELHGSVRRNYCTGCGEGYDLAFMLSQYAQGIPRCKKCGQIVRPDIVLYEECLNQTVLQKASEAMTRADLLIVGGTSLAVTPASGLIHYYQGKDLVLINKTPTPFDDRASLVLRKSIARVLGDL